MEKELRLLKGGVKIIDITEEAIRGDMDDIERQLFRLGMKMVEKEISEWLGRGVVHLFVYVLYSIQIMV